MARQTSANPAVSNPAVSNLVVSNLVVLVGEVTHDPESRDAGDGVAWQFDLATEIDADGSARRCVVPVNWYQPSEAEINVVTDGAEVLIVGTVRRRFFRSGGRTASRTEVVPDRVIPTRRKAAMRTALAGVADALSGAGEPPVR